MSTYEYWCCWCCCTYSLESYHTTLRWSSRTSSSVTHALAVELNRPTVRLLSPCVCFCSFGHLFSRVSLFLPVHFFSCTLDVPTTSKCIQLNSTYEDCVAVAVPMSTYEGCCCTYDMQHSPSWLLLLLLIVDQLVYRAVLLLCHIYHPAHAFYNKKK